ncbi:MAG: O-antigen ligase family protein [Bacteroidetes bacterium]|nr:O-antigen ligase family protein [Bacteroidota bacterium]
MRTLAVVLFSFFLPVFPRLATWITVLWFILWIVGRQGYFYFSAFRLKRMYPLIGLFLIYMLGISWSDFQAVGWREVETKLSLFIFPLLFFVGPPNQGTTYFPMRMSYLLGCTAAMAICLIAGLFSWFKTGEPDFGYKALGAPLAFHPTYFALYLNFGIVLAADIWLKGKDTRYGYRIFILVSLLFVVLLAARMQLLMLLFIGLLVYVVKAIRRGKILRSFLQAMAALLLLAALAWIIPTTRHRIQRTVQEFSTSDASSGNIRSELWQAAISAWKEAPIIGHGTGNAQAVLVQEYTAMGCSACLENDLNVHNQYLQTAVELGSLGLLYLIVVLLYPWALPRARRQSVFMLFLLLFALSVSTESMLATQRGAMFFGFFYAFFMWDSKSKQFPGMINPGESSIKKS